jgi:alpha-L-fucosidase
MKLKTALSVALAVAAIAAIASPIGAPRYPPSDAPAVFSAAERLAWWSEARFGLFIHWGPVSLKGTEISWSRANTNPLCPNKGPVPANEYDNLYKRFHPTLFNAAEWAAVAKAAGTRYVVLTAKHCDGFCLWPTETISYHIGNTPFKRDVCGELAAAVRKAGLRIGWYYSPMDWWDPDCRTAKNTAYVKRMQGQIKELVTRFGRIDLMWFDWDGGTIPWNQAETYRIVRSAQPAIVINNRLECAFGGNTADKYTGPDADYLTPEQEIGAYNDKQPWETCMTLGTQWSWKPDDKIKSADEVIRILARCAGGDGNLLLNVGPMPDGRIEPRQVEVLKKIGAWMGECGESIYGTRGGPFKPGDWGASTRKGRTIYVHAFEWKGDVLRLPAVSARIVSGRVLGGGTVVIRQSAEGIEIGVAPKHHPGADTVVVLELDGPAGRIAAVDVPGSRAKTK